MACLLLVFLITKPVALPISALSVYVPAQIIADHSLFVVRHCAKDSPSARRVEGR